jgi:hypothetical protein
MNNKPVAIVELGGQVTWLTDVLPYKAKLYTHPVKELTDEEILIVWTSSNFVRYTETGHIDEIFFNKFAKAILRKAKRNDC